MSAGPFTIAPMQMKYTEQVGRLLVHGFRGKFQSLTSRPDDGLALLFERMLDSYADDPFGCRMVVLCGGDVAGTMSLRWRGDPGAARKRKSLSWKSFGGFGTWDLMKMMLGLRLLAHEPEEGECYIADIVVHPDYRGRGVGTMLLQWAKSFVQSVPRLDTLSLFVSGTNERARHLYERLSFRTEYRLNSLTMYIFFKERKWVYMVMREEAFT